MTERASDLLNELADRLSDSDRIINNPRDSLIEGTNVRASEMPAHTEKKDAKPAAAATEKPKS